MVEYIQKSRNQGKREENKIWVRYEDPGRLELSTLSSLSLSLSFQSRPSPLFLSLFPFHLTHWSICEDFPPSLLFLALSFSFLSISPIGVYVGGEGGGWTRGTHSQTIELHLNSTLPGTQNWSDTPTCVCSLLMWWV